MNYWIAAILVSLFVGMLAGYEATHSHDQAIIAGMKADDAQAIALAQQKVTQAVEQQTKTTQRVADAYSSQIDVVRRYYTDRLRKQSAESGTGLSAASKGSSGLVETSADIGLDERCTETTVMLVDLQNWVKEQGMGQ